MVVRIGHVSECETVHKFVRFFMNDAGCENIQCHRNIVWNSYNCIVTGRNEVVAKVIFLHLFVILFTEGGFGLNACWDTTPPPGADTPLEQTPPGADTPGADTPSGADTPRSRHPPLGSRLQHTVYERPVRILLECILVMVYEISHFPCGETPFEKKN